MIEDHLGVVDETAAAAERVDTRLWELLDREILPCLERPGRQLGPFDVSLRAGNGHSNVALIWPSLAEGFQTPAALRPLFEYVAALRTSQPSLACAPAPDLELMLEGRGLPLFGRPQWTPLASHPLWIAMIAEPLDLLGLLTILRTARIAPRSCDRSREPMVVLTGEGALGSPELMQVFGDAVLATATLTPAWFERLDIAFAEGRTAADAVRASGLGPSDRLGAIAAPGSVSVRMHSGELPAAARGPRREEIAALVVRGREQLRRSRRERIVKRSNAFTDQLWIGSASARLRERYAMVDAGTLTQELLEAFSEPAGSVALDFVWGLPGETAADRNALAPLLDAIVASAPRGLRQVRVRLGWYVPSPAERAEGVEVITVAEAAASLQTLREELSSKRLPIDTTPAALASVAALLEAAGASVAPALEAIHAAGARTADSPLAVDADLWQQALNATGLAKLWPQERAVAAAAAPAEHGFAGLQPKPDPLGQGATNPSPDRASARADRWTRWQGLVPRQFDVRIEFAKTGPARLLGPGELTELFLSAVARAEIALATTGVVEPKPKLSFGPSLPAGIAGEREVVDLGLMQPIHGLLERLGGELPEGIDLRAVAPLPPHAPHLSLGHVALAEYAVDVEAEQFIDSQAREASLKCLQSWQRRIMAGRPCVDDPADLIQQVRDLQIDATPEGTLRLRFTLDLRDPGPKCRPREVLSRGLSGLSVDVRCLLLRRLRLLVLAEESGRVIPMTPFEQILAAARQQRARAKFSA